MGLQQSLGRWGEEQAQGYLASLGLSFIAKNYKCREGEIDLIMRDSEMLVFVEVKTRRSLAFGRPEESITRRKLERVISSAQSYLLDHDLLEQQWRVDVVSIVAGDRRQILHLDHFTSIGNVE